MMMQEFTERTGVTPTFQEYRDIEVDYYAFDGDKDAFCKAWVAAGGPVKLYAARAHRIEQLESCLMERGKDYEAQLKQLKTRIAALELDLEKELDWQDTDGAGTNMEQGRYEHLLAACTPGHGDPRVLTEEEAKQLIHEEFGFDPEMVEIIAEVSTYQVNKYHQLRKKETFERVPCYEATDWNYVRFNCRGWQYEMVNGQLRNYCC